MSEKDKRAKAKRKLKAEQNEFAKNLLAAEKIVDPWRRCQSLAEIAQFGPDEDVVRVANKALQAAREAGETSGDKYRHVAVASWPIGAMVIRGKTDAVQKAVTLLLDEAQHVEHPVNRLDALAFLWGVVYPIPNLRKSVGEALLAACLAADSWRAGRTMGWLAQNVAQENTTEAQRTINAMRESRYKRRAQKQLDEQTMCPVELG